jgi:hypothetical protein
MHFVLRSLGKAALSIKKWFHVSKQRMNFPGWITGLDGLDELADMIP